MHSYPWVLVRADSKEEARQACDDWINSHIESSVFDYGGPIDAADDPEHKTILQYGTEHFLSVIKEAAETEKASIREHWAVVKQFVLKFAVRDDPPPNDRGCTVTRIAALGISGLIEPGKELTYRMSAHEGFLHMTWLCAMRKHVEYRCYMDATDACLFVDENVDVDIDELLAGKAQIKNPEKLFLVQTDLHH